MRSEMSINQRKWHIIGCANKERSCSSADHNVKIAWLVGSLISLIFSVSTSIVQDHIEYQITFHAVMDIKR